MNDYILFSPVGSHDPVPSNLRDGPMLHICRKMSPSKLYIYYSSEMCANKDKDNRYVKAVEDLCRRTNKSIEIEEIFDRDMTEVQIFDVFLPIFDEYLRKIHDKNPDSMIIVNISSGTPAMKSALLILSMMMPFKLIAVQVANPEKSANNSERSSEYNGDVNLLGNKDYDEDAPDRCHIEEYTNMRAKIIRENICSHIEHYDYEAALREADGINDYLSPYSISLLSGAVERIKMRLAPLKAALCDKDRAVITELQGDKTDIFEYMLWLQMKYERGDLSDFIRGFTPALFRLAKKQLDNMGVDLTPYVPRDNRKDIRLKRELLEQNDDGRKYLRILDARFNGYYRNSPLSSEICITLIVGISPNDTLKDELKKLRDFESKIRNPVAHDINNTDEDKIKELTGFDSSDIWKSMKSVTNSVLGIGDESWDEYKHMNELLVREIKTL